ncbi:UNVERIFIED_CONTAM: tripartite ATP-independent transporter DctP family solute receptor [Brevibacillus sp. OAP136]
MRSRLGIMIFIIIGLFTAFVIGFQNDLLFTQLGYDEEQEGLKDRIVIRFSHVVAENTPKGLAAEHFSKLVSQKTYGRVEVQVFPNGILYSDTTELKALQDGDIQMIAPAVSNLSEVDPAWSALDLPYLFHELAEVNQALSGKIGSLLFDTLGARDMKGLSFWTSGFKQMTDNRNPLLSVADFAGQRFRIIPSTVLAAQMRSLGATPVPMGFNEVYRELAAGRIDGEENTISNIYSKRLYQVQRYMTLSNHGYLGYAVIMSKPFWDSLPADVQASIQEAMQETTAWSNQHTAELDKKDLALIQESQSMAIHVQTPAERAAWEAHLRPLYQQFAPDIGDALMQEIERLHQQRPRPK